MVKRVVKPANTHNVSPHHSFFFWKKCNFCHLDFRRERSFKWPVYNSWFLYSCGTCSNSIEYTNTLIAYHIEVQRCLMFDETTPVPIEPPMRVGG